MSTRTHSALVNPSHNHQSVGHQWIELPHNCRGDVDWATLGNILTAQILGEVIKASYADYKHGRMTRSFEADTDWKFAYEEHDVLVLRKQVEDSPIHCFMGRGFINLPVEEVAQFVGNIQTRKKWDKYLVEIREVQRLSDTDFLLYMYHEATHCLVKSRRDFLYYERMKFVDGKYVQTAMSVEHPILPPQPGIVRAQLHPGSGWVLEPYEGNPSKTLISYLAHVDLMSLPAIITNRVIRRQPMSIRYIRESLAPPDLFPTITGESNNQCIPSSSSFTSTNNDQDGCPYEKGPVSNGRQYEDPISINFFTGNKLLDCHSVPIEVDHHWSGDSHPARPRLISEGSRDRNVSPAATNTCKDRKVHSTATSVQRKSQDTSASCVATAQGEEKGEQKGFFLKQSVCNVKSESSSDSDHQHSEKSSEIQWQRSPKGSGERINTACHENVSNTSFGDPQAILRQLQNEATTTSTIAPPKMKNGTHTTWDTHVQELWRVLPMDSQSEHQETNGDLNSGEFDVQTKPTVDMAHPPIELLRNERGESRLLKASFVTPGSSVGSLSDLEGASTTPPSANNNLSGLPPPPTRYRDTRDQYVLPTHCFSSSNPPTDSFMVTTIASSHGSRSPGESDSSLEATIESQVGTASSGSSFKSFHSVS